MRLADTKIVLYGSEINIWERIRFNEDVFVCLAEIWSPAGGFYADPKKWRRNTVIVAGYVFPICVKSILIFINE